MTSVLGMASNLECLLPFVEHAGKNIFASKYACFQIFVTWFVLFVLTCLIC